MNEQTSNKLPLSFWIISSIALVWNLLGVMNFVGQLSMTGEALDGLSAAERALFESIPSWVNIAFGIAVIGGSIGCVGLLLRKKWATPVFIISLVAIVAQMGYSFLMTDAAAVYGSVATIMSGIVVLIGIFLVWYSKNGEKKGWLV